jgi:L-fucose mutarotase
MYWMSFVPASRLSRGPRCSPRATPLPCAVQEEARALIGADAPCRLVTRAEFYALARDPNLGLCIVTGDTRRFGNVLLTVGVDRSR